MKIVLNDISVKDHLYPFTSTRSVLDIRIGILTMREKWQLLWEEFVALSEKMEDVMVDDLIEIPANIIPSKQLINEIVVNQRFINSGIHISKIEYPWHIFQQNDLAIRQDYELITKGKTSLPISKSNYVVCPENIFLEENAVVENCSLNASMGPIYIGRNVEVMEGTMIRGAVALCEGSTVKMGTKIYGATTVGPSCIVGGEIKNSVFFGYSNKGHDGYLGDSVIGEWCNLGAGTSNSNLKNTAGQVQVWNNAKEAFLHAGNKCGLLMGDYSRAAINTSFTTGTVVGVCCNIFGNSLPSKYIPDFSWANEKYKLEKAITDIDNWKKLKGSSITPKEIKNLTDLHSN